VTKLSESSSSFDKAEWNLLLSTKRWKVAHQLNWINVVSHDDKFCLSFFNKVCDMVETILEVIWLWTDMILLVSTLSGFSLTLESKILFFPGLWCVLSKESKKIGSLISINGL